jgi:hypothetical protein
MKTENSNDSHRINRFIVNTAIVATLVFSIFGLNAAIGAADTAQSMNEVSTQIHNGVLEQIIGAIW